MRGLYGVKGTGRYVNNRRLYVSEPGFFFLKEISFFVCNIFVLLNTHQLKCKISHNY